MKKLFYTAAAALILFEVANVYFIMPMPGSQKMDTLPIAYFLYSWRWWFRIALGLAAVSALALGHFRNRPLLPLATIALWGAVTYMFNFEMTADRMFLQPSLRMAPAAQSEVDSSRIVLGVAIDGSAKAYPIQFLAYHHQVRDTVGATPVMVTYCNVCRSGRVFEPTVNGRAETFRLVGMDHFNAMFEDAGTRSWWRQENGVAVAGPLKGQSLPELPCEQMALSLWLKLHPNSLVMQPDPAYKDEYEKQSEFEKGKRTGKLTRTDTLSWQEKSWVIGIEAEGRARAFDWNLLKAKRVLNEQVGGTPVVLVLADDGKSFAAFLRKPEAVFTLSNDTLSDGQARYDFAGRAIGRAVPDLVKVAAYQEFWHSWDIFHPAK